MNAVIAATAPVTSAVQDTSRLLTQPFAAFDEELASLLSQLEAVEARKRAAQEAAQNSAASMVGELPQLFGVKGLSEVVALIQAQMGTGNGVGSATPITTAPKARPSRRGHIYRIPQQTLDQLRSMLKAGGTIAKCAKALEISEASISTYKARWGMVKERENAVSEVVAAYHRRANRYAPLSISAREGIVQALVKGEQTVAQIAKAFNTSRQSCYSIRARLDQRNAA